MKKILLFAGILAFMSCSSDDSNSPVDPVIPEPSIEVPMTKKNVLLVGYDAMSNNDFLSQINVATGQVTEIEGVEGADFEFPDYDDEAKKLYDLTEDQIITLDFNTKKLSKREFTPGFVEYTEEVTLLDGKGNLLTYFYRGYEFANYSSFYKINIAAATNRVEDGSQKLNSLLTTGDKIIFSYVLNNKKDKLYALLREGSGQGKTKYSLLLLNPNDLEDYDDNTEQKTLLLPAFFGDDMNGYGLFVDKNDNLVFVTSDNRLVQFDLATKKETVLYKLEDTYLGDMAYDKSTHNIYYLTVDKVRENASSKYTHLVTVNLDSKVKQSIELKFKNQGELELTSLVMVDPF